MASGLSLSLTSWPLGCLDPEQGWNQDGGRDLNWCSHTEWTLRKESGTPNSRSRTYRSRAPHKHTHTLDSYLKSKLKGTGACMYRRAHTHTHWEVRETVSVEGLIRVTLMDVFFFSPSEKRNDL